MAIFLKNSLFIHIPKTGGRWITQMICKHVKNYQIFGDPIYDAHTTPESRGKIIFAFVRHPAYFCHSLWHHRARKKQNKFGHKFNWQDYLRLERECKSENYEQFMYNVSKNPNVVQEYYNYYLGSYKEMILGKTETLCESFLKILNDLNEEFDENEIRKNAHTVIGGNKNQSKIIDIKFVKLIEKSEMHLCKKFHYIK